VLYIYKERQSDLFRLFPFLETSMEANADLLIALTNLALNKSSTPRVVAELKVIVALKADVVMRKHPRGRPKGTTLSYGELVEGDVIDGR